MLKNYKKHENQRCCIMIKTVITAAGKGTRLLPVTKELPKEMMPIFTKYKKNQRIVLPLLQFIFEQLYSLKFRDFCLIVGREKRSIEDHFTPHESFLKELQDSQTELISPFYEKLNKSNLMWINQHKPLGFGDAVKKSEKFVGNENFILHAGDVSIIGKSEHPITRLLKVAATNKKAAAILLCKKIKDPKRYGVPKVKKIDNSIYEVLEVEEKPMKPKSNFGILPIYFFKPIIFDCLNEIKPGRGDEYQLTDAIQLLLNKGEQVLTILLENDEREIDVGTVESYKESLEITYDIN
jgi:UTP--glucose-1-phosphate uridylyltransferase